jgi:hypothetical protein
MLGICLRKSDNDDKNDKFGDFGSPWGRGHKTRHGFPLGYTNDDADESFSSSSLLFLVLWDDFMVVALLVGNGDRVVASTPPLLVLPSLASPPPIFEGRDEPPRCRCRRQGRGRLRDRPAVATVPSVVEERNLLVVARREKTSAEVFSAKISVTRGTVDVTDDSRVVDDTVR